MDFSIASSTWLAIETVTKEDLIVSIYLFIPLKNIFYKRSGYFLFKIRVENLNGLLLVSFIATYCLGRWSLRSVENHFDQFILNKW